MMSGIVKCAKDVDYRIFTEPNVKTGRNRRQLRAGHIIRVDVLSGHFHKIPELKQMNNWKIRDTIAKISVVPIT